MGTPAVSGPMTVDGGGPLTGGAVSNPTRQASQTNQAVSPYNLPTQQSFSQNMATVYIETAFESDEWEPGGVIDWQQMYEGADGVDTTATLRVSALDFQSGEHFAEIRERLTPDRRIRIGVRIAGSASAVLFQGFVKSDSINWSDRGQGLSAMCLSEPQEYTRVGRANETSIVNGRMMRNDPTGDWDSSRVADLVSRVSGLQAIFNAGGRGNMSSAAVLVRMDGSNADDASDQHRLNFFETDGNIIANPWTYRHALRYLMFFWVAQKPLAPNLDTAAFFYDTRPEVEVTDLLTDLLDRPVRPDLSIESLNVDEAIKTLCGAAGVHYHWETFGRSFSADDGSGFATNHRFRLAASKTSSSSPRPARRRMGQPRVLSVPRRKPFENLSRFSTRTQIFSTRAIQAQLTVDTSRQINRPVYLGGYKEFECSILMRPGWVPHLKLDNVVVPIQNGLLTGDAFDEAVESAKVEWHTRFKEFEGSGRVSDRTKYHAQHPDFHDVEKVFRTWIFPDDDSYVQGVDGLTSLLTRNGTGTGNRPAWTRQYYHPYVFANGATNRANGLWYRHPTFGGGLPFGLEPEDPPGIRDWVPRERPFQDTQGRFDFSTTTRAPIVRIHFGTNLDPYEVPGPNHADWVRFAGAVEISRTRAAIRFTDDNVWNSAAFLVETRLPFKDNAIERYIEGRFWVQVTACVRGDTRMRYAPTHFVAGGVLPSQRLRHQVRDLGYDKFQIRTIDEGNSFLTARQQGLDGEGNAEELLIDPDENYLNRDDTGALIQFGDQDGANNLSHGVAGYWQQPFLDITGFVGRIGDSFVGVTGLSIQWDTYPVVIGRLHTKTLQGQQMTKLILADKRHTPEVLT